MLLAGPTGTGKELAARAFASILKRRGRSGPFVDHNAARFATADEATSTLFGVGEVFSGVPPRRGLLELAHGGTLFLDEVHNLPERVQRSLLKVLEGGKVSRIGETTARPADVRYVLASNAPAPTYSLASDLLNRLQVTELLPLKERAADIPSIFNALLQDLGQKQGVAPDEVLDRLTADDYEMLCLDGFERDNIRGLINITDQLITRLARDVSPVEAMKAVLGKRYRNSVVAQRQGKEAAPSLTSQYEKHKPTIIEEFYACGQVLTATERRLKEQGIPCCRRWLSVYLKEWGVLSK